MSTGKITIVLQRDDPGPWSGHESISVLVRYWWDAGKATVAARESRWAAPIVRAAEAAAQEFVECMGDRI